MSISLALGSHLLILVRDNIDKDNIMVAVIHHRIIHILQIEHLQLVLDPETNRSKGYGFVQYREAESAKRAKEQLNGFELAGKPIKVGEVSDKMEASIQGMFVQFKVCLLSTMYVCSININNYLQLSHSLS